MNLAKDLLKTVLLLAVVVAIVAFINQYAQVQYVGVARVVDGDSLIMQGEKLRLVGIDAPELSQTCLNENGVAYGCGKVAKTVLQTLIDVSLRCVGNQRDRYQRLLVQCNTASIDINRAMVHRGWAVAYGRFEREAFVAKNQKSGLWSGEFQAPKIWREMHKDSGLH